MFMWLLVCMLIKGNISLAATTYKDWSEARIMDRDYSYSTIFFSDSTQIEVLKNDNPGEYEEQWIDGIRIPNIKLHQNNEAILWITNCAMDKNGDMLDVVVEIDQVNEWSNRESTEVPIRITFEPFRFNNSQIHPTGGSGNLGSGNKEWDFERPITRDELINFRLDARYADCRFTIKYYKAGTYNFIEKLGVGFGETADITSINNFVYDLDIKTKPGYENEFLGGREGIRPNVDNSVIYYRTPGSPEDNRGDHVNQLIPIDGGIGTEENNFDSFTTNGVWYKSSVFVTNNNITNSTYSFTYGGTICGLWYSFMSPYPYSEGGLEKSVNKAKVKEQERFTYTLSEYIPNNFYGSLIKLNEIYNSLYKDTHYTSINISDILNSNLVIDGNIEIVNERGLNRSHYFDTTVSGNSINVSAKTDLFNRIEFYAHTYKIKIPVYIKAGTGPKLIATNVITNQGRSVITMGQYAHNPNSNMVQTFLYYDVTTSITNGTITASSSVDIHNNKTITFRPNNGYYVSSVTINGEEQDLSNYYNGGTINLSDVTRDYNIVVKTEAYGYVQITKKDANTSENVQGAIIGLYYNNTCTSPVAGNSNLVTNTSGTVISRTNKSRNVLCKRNPSS